MRSLLRTCAQAGAEEALGDVEEAAAEEVEGADEEVEEDDASSCFLVTVVSFRF